MRRRLAVDRRMARDAAYPTAARPSSYLDKLCKEDTYRPLRGRPSMWRRPPYTFR